MTSATDEHPKLAIAYRSGINDLFPQQGVGSMAMTGTGRVPETVAMWADRAMRRRQEDGTHSAATVF